MAPKIPVVLSQASGLTPQQRDHEESLIAEMLMEDHVEVSLIGSLEHLDSDDTDRLCLLGFQGDFILLSSLDSTKVYAELERLGVEGRQGATQFEPAAGRRAEQTRRRIYHIPLAGQERSAVRAEVQRLRQDAQIATVPLLGLDGATPLAAWKPEASARDDSPRKDATSAKPNTIAPQDAVPQDAVPQDAERDNPATPNAGKAGDNAERNDRTSTPSPPTSFHEWDDDEVDSELDRLVDELDELDI